MLCILHSEMLCREGLAGRQNCSVMVWPAEEGSAEPAIAVGSCGGNLEGLVGIIRKVGHRQK